MLRSAFIILWLALVLSPVMARGAGPDQSWKRVALSAQAFPNQSKTIYIDVPSASNGVSNLMMRAFIGQAQWMRQLTDAMARGSEFPTYVVVGSESDGVAYSALAKAVGSFKGKQLPNLHLALIGNPLQGEQLRSAVEALGAEYRVLGSEKMESDD